MMAAREPDEDDVTPFKCARSDDDDSESGMSQIKRRSTSVTTNRDSMINDDYLCDKPIGAEGEHKWTITTRVGDVIVPFAGNAVAGGKCGKRLARRSLVPHQRSCLCFSATDAIKSDGTQVERKPLLAAFHECVLGMIDEQERDGINHAIVHREPHGWCIDLNLLKDTELPLRNTFARMLVEFTKSSGCRNAFADISPHWWGMLTVAELADIRVSEPRTGKVLDLMMLLLGEEGSKAFGGALKHDAAKQIVAQLAQHNELLGANIEKMRNSLRVHARQTLANQAQISNALEEVLGVKKELEEQKKQAENDKLAKAQFDQRIKKVEVTMFEQLIKLAKVQGMLANITQLPHASDVDELQDRKSTRLNSSH